VLHRDYFFFGEDPATTDAKGGLKAGLLLKLDLQGASRDRQTACDLTRTDTADFHAWLLLTQRGDHHAA
jgi:hypothetical protein